MLAEPVTIYGMFKTRKKKTLNDQSNKSYRPVKYFMHNKVLEIGRRQLPVCTSVDTHVSQWYLNGVTCYKYTDKHHGSMRQ